MKLSFSDVNGVMVLSPRGKIMGGPDATQMHDQLHEFINQGKKKVVIDLAKVDWMNSTGLGILISGLTTMRNSQGELKLANVTEKIQSLLTITKLITVFDCYDSVEEAVQSFK